MKTHPIKWLAVLSPLLFVAFLEFAGYIWRPSVASETGRFWVDLVVIGVAIIVSVVIWVIIDRTSRRLERQNRELLALHDAGLDVASELTLDVVLQKVCDGARSLVGARYGALSVVNSEGVIEQFVTSGVSDEIRKKIGHLPVGKGLLGVPLFAGESLNLSDISDDSRSIGFPEHHPKMKSLLAVPVVGNGPFRGNLYLSEKEKGTRFTDADEETLRRFATQAAIAINNASLHRQVIDLAEAKERQRIAHEMHDGLAQLLGYVNTKAQAAKAYLGRGDAVQAEEQINELAKAAREVYTDVREAIVGLRALPHKSVSFGRLLEEYVETWSEQAGISASVSVAIGCRLPAQLELQLIRIVQESLTNVRKHANATHVSVHLHCENDSVLVEIEDNGTGYVEPKKRRGDRPRFGLSTMRERAESVGGKLSIKGRPGEGTVVKFEKTA